MERKLIQKLLAWKKSKDRKPLLLKGVRQVGKTHLLKTFGKQHFPTFHYINFEKQPELKNLFEKNLSPKRILSDLSFQLGIKIDTRKDFVVFDEIQEAPKALTSLKYFCEECPELHLCGAGSLLGIHLNGYSFPVGKVTFETLRPMSFEEFLMATGDKALDMIQHPQEPISEFVHTHLLDQLKTYFIVGGLPEAVKAYIENKDYPFEAFNLVRKKQDDLQKAYYADIAKHAGKLNAMHIDRIFRSAPSQLSKTQNGSSARFRFRGVVPGISHYDRLAGSIDWLEAAGLLLKVPIVHTAQMPLKAHTRDNFFKLFLFDIGLLGSMNNLSPKSILDADYGSYKGYFTENFALQELLCQDETYLVNWQEKQSEVEFLTQIDEDIIPIEIKSGYVRNAKSLTLYSQKYHPPYRVIFSSHPLNIGKHIHHYPLYLAGQFPIA